jgi:DNA-3-methyladenine glycosylase I
MELPRAKGEAVPAQAPAKIEPQTLADYFEVLTKAVFQSGMSWRVIESKWDGFREAFAGFDPRKVAAFSPADADRLAEDTRIVRNRRKIEATIDNAVEMVALEKEHGGFRDYLRSHGGFEATVADLRGRFRFLGDTGAYYFLYVVGEQVPSHEEWMASRR